MSFQQLFVASKGQPIQYMGRELKMVDRIPLPSNNASLQLEFVSANSQWKQGLVLQTKGDFSVNGQKLLNKIIFWEDTAPKHIDIVVKSKDKVLSVYNVWETEDGTMHYWHNGGALYLETEGIVRTYFCNDGFPDDDFDDLVFKLKVG